MAEKILVVDDDVQTVKLVGLTLERQGYEIIAAKSGEGALERVQSEIPDLIILDVMMPSMSGYEVCRRIREDPDTAAVPVLMFTAKSDAEARLAGFEAGADGYMTKPVHPRELVSRVEGLLLRAPRVQSRGNGPPSNVIGFLGSKGGVGVTTLAVNVAVALALGPAEGQRVVLAELQPGMATAGLQLGFPRQGRIVALLERPLGEINADLVEAQLDQHDSGLLALTGRVGPPGSAQPISADHGELIVKHLGNIADYVLLDLGVGLTEVNRRVLPRCRRIVVAIESNPISLTLAERLLQAMNEELNVAGHKINIVLVNRSRSTVSVTKDTIQERLEQPLTGMVPPVPEQAFQSSKLHIPIVTSNSESFAARQYRTIAEALLEAL